MIASFESLGSERLESAQHASQRTFSLVECRTVERTLSAFLACARREGEREREREIFNHRALF